MRRSYQSSVRMGALNLLVLIIALSLVVLSVLALVSANSAKSFTAKQEIAAAEYYTQEIAGQSFVSSVDDAWSTSDELTQNAIDGILSTALSRVNAMSDGIDISGTAELIEGIEMYQMMGIPYELHGHAEPNALDLLDTENLEYTTEIASALNACEKGIVLELEMASGRQLNALVGLAREGGVIVLKWESTREWKAEGEELWMPDGDISGEQVPSYGADSSASSGAMQLNEGAAVTEMDVAEEDR